MKRIVVVLCCIVLFACGGGSSAKFSKEKVEQPKPSPVPEISNTVEAKRNWSVKIGAVLNDSQSHLKPVLHEQTIFTADAAGVVKSVNAANGRSTWRTALKAEISGGVGVGDGLVLVGTPGGKVIALDRETGELAWEKQLSSEILAAPAAAAGTTVARSVDGRVFGLSSSNGEQAWTFQREVPTLSLRGDGPPLIAKGAVVVGFASGKIVAASLTNGRILWDASIAKPRGQNEVERMIDIDAMPVFYDNVLYVASYNDKVAALALGGQQRVLWTLPISSYTDLAVDEDSVYIADDSGVVTAVDRLSGRRRWDQSGLLRRNLSGPAVAGSYLVVGDFEGYVHILSKENGELIGRVRLGKDAIATTPIANGDQVYVTTNGGSLVALTLSPSS